MTKQNIRIRQIALMLISLLMIFSSAFVSNAAVNNDNTISPYYLNISNRLVNLSISGIKANCSATVQSKKSVALKIKMELQKEKSSGYETVETWTSSKTGTILAMSESRNINILCNYRLKVTFTAGSETEIVYKYWWIFCKLKIWTLL